MSGYLLFLLAASGAPLQPTSKWLVNFDDSQCTASRNYGSASEPLTLLFKQPVTGDVVQLAVAVGALGGSEPHQFSAQVSWGSGPSRKLSGLSYRAKPVSRQIYLLNLPKAEVDAAKKESELTLEGDGLRRQFQITNLTNLLTVMDDCVKDLRQHWNMVDKGAPDPLRRHAKASLVSLFSTDDYPAVSVSNEDSGQVSVVLLIAPDGKIADCTLTETSGVPALDAQTCAIIQTRGRYAPAVGQDGKPARDVDHARIRWVMP